MEKQKVILRKEPPTTRLESEGSKVISKIEAIARKSNLYSTSDKLAQDKMYYVNYRWRNTDQFNPDRKYFYVDKYYPFAVGGPLFIDEPHHKDEFARCEKKAIEMRELKLRYIYVIPEKPIEELLNQLEVSQ